MRKVIIVTGASSGIGLETCKRLCKENKVYGIARNFVEDLPFKCYQCDVNDYDSITNIFKEIYEIEGRIDVVINNAGMGIAGAMEYTDVKKIEYLFQTNLISLVKISALAVKYLKETKGKIINTSSVAGIMPIAFQACYSASKAGVLNYSMALDGEVRRFGIRVTAVLPGDTKTGFTKARQIDIKEDGYNGRVMKSIKRMEHDEQHGCSPEKVAKVIEKIIQSKKPPLKVVIGLSYKMLVFLTRLLPTSLVNYILRKIYA